VGHVTSRRHWQWPEIASSVSPSTLRTHEMCITWKRFLKLTDLIKRIVLRTKPLPDDRSSSTACLRRSRARGPFALCLHVAGLADCARGRAFVAVIRSSVRRRTISTGRIVRRSHRSVHPSVGGRKRDSHLGSRVAMRRPAMRISPPCKPGTLPTSCTKITRLWWPGPKRLSSGRSCQRSGSIEREKTLVIISESKGKQPHTVASQIRY
jgi:hypothetical protein